MDQAHPQMIHPREWMELRPGGLYCKPGGFFIDPTRRVPLAVITHGHSDHARKGHAKAVATPDTLAIMACRYGEGFAGEQAALPYGQTVPLGEAHVTLYPAGHILGSAQVLIEYGGARIAISGDYKRVSDPSAQAYEPVACDVFVTEATFALPVFHHPEPQHEIGKLLRSLSIFPGSAHLTGCYALGKTQRLIAELRRAGYDKPVYLHDALIALTHLYEERGVSLGPIAPVTPENSKHLAGEIVLCPPSALADRWSRTLPDPILAAASGWMQIRARARQQGVELPLIISDHCDWPQLIEAIHETGAGEIWVTHGREDALVHYCRKAGLAAHALSLPGRVGDETGWQAQ
jgi:putative mRNA 3-end processing factor